MMILVALACLKGHNREYVSSFEEKILLSFFSFFAVFLANRKKLTLKSLTVLWVNTVIRPIPIHWKHWEPALLSVALP